MLIIAQENQETSGRFVERDGQTEAGEMTYSIANEGKLWIVDHTGVLEAYKGQRIGTQLFRALVAQARLDGIQVLPLCPFTRAQFERHPEDRDVLRHGSL